MEKRQVLLTTGDPDEPLVSLDNLTDELFGPEGTPERERMERYSRNLRRRWRRAERLTSWLRHIPPRWVYATDEFNSETIKYYHGIGHIAYVFWSDVVEDLDEAAQRLAHRGFKGANWKSALAWKFYSLLDGLAFHYLDDAYVPTIADVQQRVAGRRQNDWRRRHNAAIDSAMNQWEELQPALKEHEQASLT